MANNKTTEYYLGVDAGGTTCRARLEAVDGRTLGSVTSGPATIRRSADFAANVIEACIIETIATANLESAILARTSLVVGAAGTESSSETDKLTELLAQMGARKLRVISDARIACVGAHAGGDGGIVIVGTGSIGYALINDEPFRVGGFGFPASDLGSGAHIGLAAVQHALTMVNANHPPSKFATAILDKVGTTCNQVALWSADATATDYAQFAPIVVEQAKNGDAAAKRILTSAANHIADLITALENHGVARISLVGGLSSIIAPLLDPKLRILLSKPAGDAVNGAISLARMDQ